MKTSDVMTRNVLTVGRETSVANAIRVMLDHNVSGLPVLDNGKVVGIVTEGDLLRRSETGTERHRPRWLEILMGPGRMAGEYVRTHGRSDDDILEQILAELAKAAWVPKDGLSISVKEGVVDLNGVILEEKEREALRVVAENVPGVKAVEDHLVWIEPVSGTVIDPPQDQRTPTRR